ncbi:MAG TPA: cupredoxin domain-containing protein [Candidatus Saccharimonadales bacterium]|jgi:plastocyanin|nr:cupredoxin domain-containing protein [Candidatus Saccharimonadales bacterium]
MISAAVALLALGGAAYFMSVNNGDGKTADLADAQVQITDTGFSPATVKVKKGQRVTWSNDAVIPRQVLGSNAMPALNTDVVLQEGDTVTVTMDQPGTYSYHDAQSVSDISGTIIVE